MKSIFSQFFKSSLFNRVMRLIIVVVCLSYSAAATAGTNYYLQCKAAVATNSIGNGKVYIYKNEKTSSDAPDEGLPTDETSGNWESTNQNRKVTLFAYPEEGYYHKGWTRNDPSGNSVLEGLGKEYKEPYVADVYTASDDRENPSTITFYAVFRAYYLMTLYGYNAESDQFETLPLGGLEGYSAEYSDMVTITGSDFEEIYKIDLNHDIDVSSIRCTSTVFDCEIREINGNIVLAVSNKDAITEATSGSVVLSVKDEWNKDKTVDGTVATLNLSVTLADSDPITVTLNPAEGLMGTYTYKQNTTGTQVFSVTTSPIIKEMRTGTDYSFSFTPTPNDATKYQFEKWVIIDANGNTTEEATANLSYTFKGNESIYPVFTAIDRAIFIVKSEPNARYIELQAALNRAAALKTSTGKDQVVVVTVEGTRKGGRLVKGDYTIPRGVTLLVPGDAAYTTLIGPLKEESFGSSEGLSTFCTLQVEDNTTFAVNGNIALYGKICSVQGSNGRVSVHGLMKLGKHCRITVNNGGGLHAFGFIQGDPSSHITMENGAMAYESFNFLDWRGGNEVYSMTGDDNKVFPVGQYYVQNIEIPITFKYGAKEYLTTCVDVSIAGKVATNMLFITNTGDDTGFLQIGQKTTLTKQYIPETDRLVFTFQGDGSSNAISNLGHMALDMKVLGFIDLAVDSKDYVMPIQNNIDIYLHNTSFSCQYDVALLPGSQIYIAEDASMTIPQGASVYFYDRGARRLTDGGNGGYWYINNGVMYNNLGRPGGIRSRGEDSLVDAKMVVNGSVIVDGALYTVAGAYAGEDTAEHEGGADITSEGGGKMKINNKFGNKQVTYQWVQDQGAQSIALSSPNLLLHNDKSKGATNAYTPVSNAGTYTYYRYDGTWRSSQQSGITGIALYDNNGTKIEGFDVTLPTAGEQSGYLYAYLDGTNYVLSDFTYGTTSGNGFKLNTADAEIAGNKLKVPVTYTPQDIHGEHSLAVEIRYGGNSTPFTLLATEDYQPVFTAATALHINGRINEPTLAALAITTAEDNVLTLSENNDVNINWIYEIKGTNAQQFQFTFGNEGNKLSGAQVTFTPTSTNQVQATLKLTVTYTDAADPAKVLKQEHTVALTGNGLKIDNTLAFNDVGTIKTTTSPFALLNHINSTEEIKVTTQQVGSAPVDSVLTITKDDNSANSNYTVTPKGVGQVKVIVTQDPTSTHTGTTIETTIVVVADPKPLTEVSCIDGEENFKALTSALENVAYLDEGQIKFTSTEDISTWTAHFNSMPGLLTFTPDGDGYWAIQESKDGVNWSQLVWWTQLPSNTEQAIALTPNVRKIRIQYIALTRPGSISGLCINPFSIYPESNHVYVPVENGVVKSTKVVFTHVQPTIEITPPKGWTAGKSTSENLGGVLNTYYKTTVTISGGTGVEEQSKGFTLKATQGSETVEVALSTYAFRKALPIESADWATDNAKPNINGYDESEHYYWYMTASEYVKWDAERQNVVFLNKGTDNDAVRQVAFGYDGLPSQVQFQSASSDWTIEESTDGNVWTPSNTEALVVTVSGGANTITQPISHTSKYVRITYVGTEQNEVLLNNLVIEGFPSAVANSEEVVLSKSSSETEVTGEFIIHVMNLEQMQLALDNTEKFSLWYNNNVIADDKVFTSSDNENLAMNKEGDITIQVKWNSTNIVDEAKVIIYNAVNSMPLDTVRIVGKKSALTSEDVHTGLYTGVPEVYELEGELFENYDHHEVVMTNAFDGEGNALFDYLFIYGETTTTDGTTTILEPTATAGSNAKTPYYIYMKKNNTYEFVQAVENANDAFKASLDRIPHQSVAEGANGRKAYAIVPSEDGTPLRVYMTGFCPYATTGCTSDDEGVWYFRGVPGAELHLYLEECHIYSRNKTQDGRSVGKNDPYASSFTGSDVVKGSGAVFVFENYNAVDLAEAPAFDVTIHTLGRNILKSNYGSYYTMIGTAQAAQVSSPIQVRLAEGLDFEKAKTTLTFDDIWLGKTERTNGFLSLQKRVNNAPSIDLGNRNTVVNFRGGRVELQNAQIVSPNYKTTLAISFRSGQFGNIGIGFAKGVGTDDATGGTIHFYDGTTTVRPMKVDALYQAYYLMDQDDPATKDKDESQYTSCLRCPTNTFVHGGSHCAIRSCIDVTSKGGAPKDTVGNLLGRYTYTGATSANGTNGLVTPEAFPGGLKYKGSDLSAYHANYPGGGYGLESVTPDDKGQLYFWIPEGVVNEVKPETDGLVTMWKACMTEITASAMGYEGSIGGLTYVEEDEIIYNLLYCQLDTIVHSVISAHTGSEELENITYSYSAPVVDPTGKLADPYLYVKPTHVGNRPQEQIISEVNDYKVNNKIYYITTALADTWMNFSMPFDVEKIWVVEPYKESEIEAYYNRIYQRVAANETDPAKIAQTALDSTLRFQAQHNADFAAFFGVAMAIGADELDFEDIHDRYLSWAQNRADAPATVENPRGTGLYTGGTYNLRDKYELRHYDGSNFLTADYYLYQNTGNWTFMEDTYQTQWQVVPRVANGGVLMHKHEVYSMLFPYCWGCERETDVRDYWDYWTGKFLIFESTPATAAEPHRIKNSTYVATEKIDNNDWIMDGLTTETGSAVLLGNSTFSMMKVPTNENFLLYDGSTRGMETFGVISGVDSIVPTATFLIANSMKPIQMVTRSGRITYREPEPGNVTTGGNMPTLSNGAQLFITAIDNGINIAVSEPQHVRVVTSTGAAIYSGDITNSEDVILPIHGVYIVYGDSEIQKIIY